VASACRHAADAFTPAVWHRLSPDQRSPPPPPPTHLPTFGSSLVKDTIN
jgi:hypothetical protein